MRGGFGGGAVIRNTKPAPAPEFDKRRKTEPEPGQLGFSPSKSGRVRAGLHGSGYHCHAYQQLQEILTRLTRVEQAPPSAPAPPPSAPGPSRQGDDDYANEFDPNFTMLNSDDSLFR